MGGLMKEGLRINHRTPFSLTYGRYGHPTPTPSKVAIPGRKKAERGGGNYEEKRSGTRGKGFVGEAGLGSGGQEGKDSGLMVQGK